MKEYDMIQALSGKGDFGKPKAGFGLYHEIVGSDGSTRPVEDIGFVEKPEIRIFKDFNNMVRIDFVYEFADDMDLMQQYLLLERFFQPENSANFTDEDVLNTMIANHEIFGVLQNSIYFGHGLKRNQS